MMLRVVMMKVIMLSVVMLNIVLLSVVAPPRAKRSSLFRKKSFITLTPYFLGARFIIAFSLKIDQDPTRECGRKCKKILDLFDKFEKLGNSLFYINLN